MHFYLVNAISDRIPVAGGHLSMPGYRPRLMHKSAISLRRAQQPLLQQRFFVAFHDPIVALPNEVYLGDDADANPGVSVRRSLENRLGYGQNDLATPPTVKDIILRTLTNPPSSGWPTLRSQRRNPISTHPTDRRRKTVVIVGGEKIIDIPVVEGGASYEDDGSGSDEDPLGGDWIQATGGGDLDRVSNTFRASATETGCSGWVDSNVVAFDGDQEITMTPTFDTGYLGPHGRGTNVSGPDGYFGGVSPTETSHQIWRNDNGSMTKIADTGADPTSGVDVRFVLSGSTLEVFGDGDLTETPQTSTTDTTYTSGQPGMHLFIYTISTDYLTNFSATDGLNTVSVDSWHPDHLIYRGINRVVGYS